MSAVLLDTTVLVDALRGIDDAVSYLESLPGQPSISTVTVAELYAGVRPDEEPELEAFLEIFRVLSVDEAIARQAGYWRRDFGPSEGTSLTDALIAATAERHDLELATHNLRHFPMVDRLIKPYSVNG